MEIIAKEDPLSAEQSDYAVMPETLIVSQNETYNQFEYDEVIPKGLS